MQDNNGNPIAAILKGIGWAAIILAIGVGLALIVNGSGLLSTVGWIVIPAGAISGLVFLGFGEIIALLTQIRDKIK